MLGGCFGKHPVETNLDGLLYANFSWLGFSFDVFFDLTFRFIYKNTKLTIIIFNLHENLLIV